MCNTVYTIQVMGTNTYFKKGNTVVQDKIYEDVFLHSVSKHLQGLRHLFVASCLLQLWFESHHGKGISVSCECCV